jgi:hypothetical protein
MLPLPQQGILIQELLEVLGGAEEEEEEEEEGK